MSKNTNNLSGDCEKVTELARDLGTAIRQKLNPFYIRIAQFLTGAAKQPRKCYMCEREDTGGKWYVKLCPECHKNGGGYR